MSPKTPALCRVVLLTSDNLLTQAVRERISGSANASVLQGTEELKGLINTLVSNAGEDFIAQLKPKAAKLFFVAGDEKEALFYKEDVKGRLENKFAAHLALRPEGTSFRTNLSWTISKPNFSRKQGRRIFWISRIEIEVEIGIVSDSGDTTTLLMPGQLVSPLAGRSPSQPTKPEDSWSRVIADPLSLGLNTQAVNTQNPDWSQYLLGASHTQYALGTPHTRIVTNRVPTLSRCCGVRNSP